jgi:DNA polymerase III delta subunit
MSTAAGTAPLSYFWGDDSYGLDAAVEAFRVDAARFPSGAPERWRPELEPGDPSRVIGEVIERLTTGTMWGGGTLAVVTGIGGMIRRTADRDGLLAAFALVAPGNGLALVEETRSGAKDPPNRTLADAIRAAGGLVRRVEAPREGGLAAWIEARARERRIALGPGASRALATRVGGFVREGDADRANQGRRAVMELEKLALLRSDGAPVSVADVEALVQEAIPGTMWGFVDAVGMRQRKRSLELLDRLIASEPAPVLLAVLHRRLRELIEVQDRLERGETPGSLVRSMKVAAFRAETLARQASAWNARDLDAALDGLLALDARIKGVGGSTSSDARDRLAFDLWVTDLAAPA